ERLEAGPYVGKRADFFLELPIDELDGAGVESGAGELGEVTLLASALEIEFDHRQINFAFASGANDVPTAFEGDGQGELLGEHVDGADGQQGETGLRETIGGIADAIEDFVHGAIAAGGDDGVESFGDGLGGEGARATGGDGLF